MVQRLTQGEAFSVDTVLAEQTKAKVCLAMHVCKDTVRRKILQQQSGQAVASKAVAKE